MTPVIVHRHEAAGVPRRRALLLHGLANSSTVWDDFLRRRPDWLECWTADLPWRSDGPPQWSHRTDLTPWLAEALDAADASVVVAHSFSANLLLRLLSAGIEAGEDPLRRHGIAALVLVAPFYRRSPEQFDWSALRDPQTSFLHIMSEGVRLRSGRPLTTDREIGLAQRVCERVGPYGWIRFFEMYLGTPWLRLADITVPSLVVTGAADATAMEGAELAVDLPHGMLHMAAGSGHFPMCAQPDWFARAVTQFCHQLPAELAASTTLER